MTVSVNKVSRAEAAKQIFSAITPTPEEAVVFDQWFKSSTDMWIGCQDDRLVCAWGLVAPSLLSDQAYLWLYTTPALQGNEFLFVRHSQRAVANMLELHPTIVGHVQADATDSVRWLSWLKARFGPPIGPMIPFTIRKRRNG